MLRRHSATQWATTPCRKQSQQAESQWMPPSVSGSTCPKEDTLIPQQVHVRPFSDTLVQIKASLMHVIWGKKERKRLAEIVDRAVLFLTGKRIKGKKTDSGIPSFPGQTHCLLAIFLKPFKACFLLPAFLYLLPELTTMCNMPQYTRTGWGERGEGSVLFWFVLHTQVNSCRVVPAASVCSHWW